MRTVRSGAGMPWRHWKMAMMTDPQPEAPVMKPDGVKIGGLKRCCLGTLDDHYPDGPAAKATEGEVLPCKHCSSQMIFCEGFWRWDRD